ncbi:aldo/keto reductase [Pseudoalteromonas aurantia]|uniref:NADP-dependent oxidoreductase domain-containing protein n=1 Tax=Pseudoalteromonas aurantia 208 TaxID=1314867 RepID=A0ABR9E8T7_9GAMM|nr:aldo/keto reductase [Pseudoalteromonas aurantia]MBE0367404.1 hypothetical protein [Pseudoalteromonas aurantia 208]
MRLALGGVQFGTNYGVSNRHGQPSQRKVAEILTLAQDSNIEVIDTAIAYGNSEQVLGELVDITKKFEIITKLPPLKKKKFSPADCAYYSELLDLSYQKLQTKKLSGLLFHSADDILKEGNEELLQKIHNLKKTKRLVKSGVSLYSQGSYSKLLNNPLVELVQIPYNCFDTFFSSSGYLQKFKERNIEVHARSSFLQGLLLMDLQDIPKYFLPWLDKLALFSQVASELSLSNLELALSYVVKEPNIDKLVIGVNDVKELEQVTQAYNKALDVEHNRLPNLSSLDPKLINPAHWQLD